MKEIVKAAIGFLNTDTDAQLIQNVGIVDEKMTENAKFPNPLPTLETIGSFKGAFEQGCIDAAGGGTALTALKNSLRADLCKGMRGLAGYVTLIADGDMAVLRSSGFPVQKPTRAPATALSAPATPTLDLGANSGELDAATTPMPGAYVFNWRIALASAPEVDVDTAQTTAAFCAFSGLKAGETYIVQVNATGTVNTSDWSDNATSMVM